MTTHTLHASQNMEKKYMELLRNLREKIEGLEKEKAGLLAEIEVLKEKGEVKARELENEVTMLRNEVEELERLLNVKNRRGLVGQKGKRSQG